MEANILASKLDKNLNIKVLTTSRIRTLSSSLFHLLTPDSDSGPLHEITHDSENKQWNTDTSAAFARMDGFDFPECSLKDVFPIKQAITQGNNPTASANIWIPTRGRLLLKFDKPIVSNTHLHYQISETASSIATIAEQYNKENTLLLCPRDEGIGENEPMTICIWRTRNNDTQEIAHGEKLVLYCHTYGEPEVKITNPKNLKPRRPNAEDYSPNYPLWTTEVINKLENDDEDDIIYICPILSLMVTQDATDDSGIPTFTRVNIKEYKGADKRYTGQFQSPSNKSIYDGTADEPALTCQWTGVFKDDDGSLISLSGMTDQRLVWTPKYNQPSNLDKYEDHKVEKKVDLRVCFRAGYKYKISVRRFHGYAAGYANINDSGFPQYGYDYKIGTDYPAYYQALECWTDDEGNTHSSSAGKIWYDITNQYGSYRSYLFAGPPLNYDVNDNNTRSTYDPIVTTVSGAHYYQYRWVGPYAGDTIGPEDMLYPGFSDTHSIIIDCVRNQTSRKNLITIRPASQEISADKWLTFGYRHLARSMSGFDGRRNRPAEDFRDDSDHTINYNNDGSPKYLDYRGMMQNNNSDPNQPYQVSKDPNTSNDHYYKQTWEGTDTTARRVGKMYTALLSIAFDNICRSSGKLTEVIDKIYNSTKCSGACNKKGEPKAGTSRSAITPTVKIYLKAPLSPNDKLSDGSPGWKLIYDHPNVTESSVFDPKYTRNFVGLFNSIMAPSGNRPSASDVVAGSGNDGSWECVYNQDESNYYIERWGNQYEWVPFINAQNGTNMLPISKTGTISDNNLNSPNPNKIVDKITESNKFNGYYLEDSNPKMGGCTYSKFLAIDNKHCFNDVDKYTPSWSANNDGEAKEVDPIWIHESNIETSTTDNDEQSVKARAQKNRHFSITASDTNSSAISSQTGEVDASKSTGEGGRQYFTFSNQISTQRHPGRLYLRVPTGQDCENGVYEKWDPRSVANRTDYMCPTVRTTHYEFYKTYVSGELFVEIFFSGNLIYATDESDTNASGETVIKHTTSDPTPFSNIYQYDMSDIGLGNVGQKVTNVKHISKLDINGKALEYDKFVIDAQGTQTDTLSYNNVLTVFGEDNNGLGRCLTANDFTALYYEFLNTNKGACKVNYVNEIENSVGGNGGGIDVPIRVRYTPCAQPEISDYLYSGTGRCRTNRLSNVISLIKSRKSCSTSGIVVKEYQSQSIQSDMKWKDHFSLDISYGLYNDKCRGFYKSGANPSFYRQHRLLTGALGQSRPNTDIYPAVGICNAFMVILFPHGAKNSAGETCDYTDQAPNWWGTRSNFEEAYAINSANPVIVADLAYTDIYNYLNFDPQTEKQLNNKLATTLRVNFNYTDLVIGNKVISNVDDKTITTRNSDNVLKDNVWYDLIVVPIFTNRVGFSSNYEKYKDLDFIYKDGAGSINGKDYGGGESTAQTVDFYGSNPLVIKKFLNIAKISETNRVLTDSGKLSSCGGGGSHNPDDPKNPPFGVEGCIMYPNVNHVKFNPYEGDIKECPGFWLNNTFKVIIRAPHFRTQSQIKNDSYYTGSTKYEQSLENASSGKLKNPEDFEWSDVMIHIGKFDDYVRVRDADTGKWEYDTDPITNEKLAFSSAEFQKSLNENAMDKEWLNARNIYTVRTNPEAWSKRVPEIEDSDGNVRDLIKAGSFDRNGKYYKDRMVVFNPNMVKAYTYDKEGFYMQVRFLNAVYATTSQQGTWSSWCGGINDDTASRNFSADSGSGSVRKDEELTYYVPIRSYTDILTGYRNFIKESTPGSMINTANKSKAVTADYNQVFENKTVKGTGGSSPNHKDNFTFNDANDIRNFKDEAAYIEHESMLNGSYIVPEDDDIPSIQQAEKSTYQPWKPDHDMLRWLGYKQDPNHTLSGPEGEVLKRHLEYHEMLYLAYIIYNMAKLYYADYPEQNPIGVHALSPKDFGWSLGKELLNNYTRWNDIIKDGTSSTRKAKAKQNCTVEDQFFRHSIDAKDFDNLLSAMRKILDFQRDEVFTGKHTSKTDTTDSQGVHTGETVLPVNGDILTLDKATSTGQRMQVGSDINRPTEENRIKAIDNDWNYQWHRQERNYIDRLWYLLKTYLIKESDPTKAE